MSTTSRHRSGRGRTVTRDSSRSRTSSSARTTSRGGTTSSVAGATIVANERTRLVGTRTGLGADVVVLVVRALRALSDAVAAVFREAAEVVTPLGWGMLVAASTTLVLGYGFGWAEITALGWALTVIVVVASLFLLGGAAHEVTLTMVHDRVVVGDTAVGSVVVRNPHRRRLLGATLEVPVGDGLVELPLPSLGGRARHEEVFTVPAAKRGVVRIGPVRTVRADPIGLVRREHEWNTAVDLFVHPVTVSVPSTSTGFVRDLEGLVTRDLTSSDVAFHALRDYQPGDDRRYIHWRSTAKQGSFMVRQFEETRRSQLLVALTLAAGDYEDDEQFELAVGVAGSLGVRAIRDGRDVSVVVSERTPEFAKRSVVAARHLRTVTPVRLLDDLAGLEHATSALPIAELARVAADEVGGISVAYLVLGSTPSVAQLRSAAAAFPPGVDVVAVVCDAGFAPGLTRVGDLTVLTVGYLDDLQKSLARSRSVS